MLIERDLIRSDPWWRVIATSSLSPSLASQAPKVSKIMEKKIEGEEEKNGRNITKINTTPSSNKSAIKRWVR